MKRKTRLTIAAIILLLIPIQATCGTWASDFTCAAPPTSPNTEAAYYYEVEPLGIALLEMLTQSNIRIYYSSGEK